MQLPGNAGQQHSCSMEACGLPTTIRGRNRQRKQQGRPDWPKCRNGRVSSSKCVPGAGRGWGCSAVEGLLRAYFVLFLSCLFACLLDFFNCMCASFSQIFAGAQSPLPHIERNRRPQPRVRPLRSCADPITTRVHADWAATTLRRPAAYRGWSGAGEAPSQQRALLQRAAAVMCRAQHTQTGKRGRGTLKKRYGSKQKPHNKTHADALTCNGSRGPAGCCAPSISCRPPAEKLHPRPRTPQTTLHKATQYYGSPILSDRSSKWGSNYTHQIRHSKVR